MYILFHAYSQSPISVEYLFGTQYEKPPSSCMLNVAFICSLTERREGWRRLFFQELLPQVSNAKTLTEATSALNQYIWGRWRITLKADQKPEIMSPYEVHRSPMQL